MGKWLQSLLITVICLSLLVWPPSVYASANLALSGSSSVQVGKQISLHVVVNTNQPVNAVDTIVSFPAHLLEVVRVENTGSLFPTDGPGSPSINNAGGKVQIIRYALNPFNGNGGRVGTIVFRAKASGTANLSFGVSKVVAHDGQGTNVYTGGASKNISITAPVASTPTPTPKSNTPNPVTSTPKPTPTPIAGTPSPAISSSTHPDQNAWYQETQVQLQWTGQASGYNVAIDQNPQTQLPEQINQTANAFQHNISGDGTWYAHVRAQSTKGWSATAHYKIQIDNTAPTNLQVSINPSQNISSRPTFTFSAQDASPLKYQIQFNKDGQWLDVTSPHQPKTITAGPQVVYIRAIDAAGNSTQAEIAFEVVALAAPTLTRPQAGHHGPFEIEGQAQPGHTIQIFINGRQVEELLKADEHGAFAGNVTYYKRQADDPDQFTVKIRAVNADGIASEFSPEITVPVGDYFVIAGLAGNLAIPNWAGFAGISVILLILVGTIIFLLLRLRKLSQSKGIHPDDNQFNPNNPPSDKPKPWAQVLGSIKAASQLLQKEKKSDPVPEQQPDHSTPVESQPVPATPTPAPTFAPPTLQPKIENSESDTGRQAEAPEVSEHGATSGERPVTSSQDPKFNSGHSTTEPQDLQQVANSSNPEFATSDHKTQTTIQSPESNPETQPPTPAPAPPPTPVTTPVPTDAFDAVIAAEKEQQG